MDLRIRNPYITKFLNRFSNQNELKVIKYLTILGIHTLETEQLSNISFSDLKKKAKNISKSCSKEEKLINKELHIIKNELAKLNKKFEQKLGEEPKDSTLNQEAAATLRSSSVPRTLDKKNTIKKPPTNRRYENTQMSQELEKKEHQKTKRASSIEPPKHADWSNAYRKTSNQIDGITLKPNEIAFPGLNHREHRNFVTRHHLDDTEAKRVMTEEGVVYFPNKEKNRSAGRSSSHKAIQKKSTDPSKDRFKSARKLEEMNNDDNADDKNNFEDRSYPKSPNFISTKKNASKKGNMLSTENNITEVSQSGYEQKKEEKSRKKQHPIKKGSKTSNKENIKSNGKVRQKILREKAMNFGKGHHAHAERLPTKEFSHVESKIRDEVNYHKELSKQYKKMRQSIQDYTEQSEDKFSDASLSRTNRSKDNKFLLVTNQRPSEREKHFSSHVTHHHEETSMLETPSSSQESPYQKYAQSRYIEKSPGYSISQDRLKKSEMQRYNENLNQSKNSPGKGFGGMLDIANSFLNSPFMKHLSNMDGRNASSSSSSINPSASVSVRGNTYGRYDVSEEPSENLGRPIGEDDPRFRQIHRTYSKYPEWEVSGKTRKGGRENSYLMNESTNNKYSDFNGKESGYYNNKNEGTSFASSHFSNFLNDEMKGFFQKETLDLKKPKNPRSMMKSSTDSSRISFNANEFTSNVKGANSSHVKKNSDFQGRDKHNNKSCLEDLADTPNVFREDRMSMSHLLNTS